MTKNAVDINGIFKVQTTHHNKTSKLALVPKQKCHLERNLSIRGVILAILLCLGNLEKFSLKNGK